MSAKKVGDPCPKCASSLQRRRRAALFRLADGDIAWCAPCNAAWEIAGEEALAPDPALAPLGAR